MANAIGSVFKKSSGKSKLMFGFVAVIAVAMIGFGLSGKNVGVDELNSAVDQGGTRIGQTSPVGKEVNNEYIEVTKKANEDRIKAAKEQGNSAIPTIISLDNILKENEQKKNEQKKNESVFKANNAPVYPKKIIQQPVQTQQKQQFQLDPNYQAIYKEQERYIEAALNNLNGSLGSQLHGVDYFASGAGLMAFPDGNVDGQQANNSGSNGAEGAGNTSNPLAHDPDNNSSGNKKSNKHRIPVGTIIPAVTITEANSDAKGPLRAKIIGGELDGAIVVGEFSVNEESISMVYKTITKEGNVATINAFAVDPDTSRTSLATDVNHHYAYRYGMLASATFLKGFSTAVSDMGGTTTTTTTGTVQVNNPTVNVNKQLWAGAAELGNEFAGIAKDNYKTPNTITVASGQLIGLLFVDSANDNWLPQLRAEDY